MIMRKNRFYIILAVLTIIFLFSFSALCNQCSTPAEDKIDVGGQEENDEASDDAGNDQQDPDPGNGEDDPDNQDDDGDDGEAEAPTIDLVIYEGPILSADGVCYYRIRADVTGKPSPDVVFSRDDSDGAWLPKKVQINLSDPADSYTLTATATNSEGSVPDSITLTWGCNGGSNGPPVIASIVVDQNFHYTDETYSVIVNASDPDGDAFTVTWSVSGGSINNVHANPMNWTTPSAGGDYDITVEVDDGNGGIATLPESVNVLPALPPPVFNKDVPHVSSEGGYLEGGLAVNASGCLYAGDTDNNVNCHGYISYDITELAGATITNTDLTFTLKKKWGDPSFHDPLFIGIIYWGPNPIYANLLNTFYPVIQEVSSSGSGSFTCTASKLKEELQKAINDGKTRFQITICFSAPYSNNNNDWDGWEYDQDKIVLNVTGHH
ncbi:MAG TPA: hypothetical protein DCP02_07510 [Actinobacteria bacterium]|nr:hypothetical protein [Actinomycetota bacterium]